MWFLLHVAGEIWCNLLISLISSREALLQPMAPEPSFYKYRTDDATSLLRREKNKTPKPSARHSRTSLICPQVSLSAWSLMMYIPHILKVPSNMPCVRLALGETALFG